MEETNQSLTIFIASAFLLVLLLLLARRFFEKIEAKKKHREYLTDYNKKVEADRKNLAEYLHDVISPKLNAIKMKAENISESGAGLLPEQKDDLSVITKNIKYVNELLKSQERKLYPPLLDKYGLKIALDALLDETFINGIEISRKISDEGIDKKLHIPLYRFFQNAVSNIVKHSQAKRAVVLLEKKGDTITGKAEDDGRGFDATELFNSFGLRTMEEQIRLADGKYTIVTGANGTTIEFTIVEE